MFEFSENDNNLRTKLIKFLKLDIFFLGVQKQLEHNKEEIQKYQTEIQKYQKKVDELKIIVEEYKNKLQEMSLLGVDYHMRSDSWGVICINGKQPYIKFFEISRDRNIREIQQIIDHLQPDKNKITIDDPQQIFRNIERF